MRAMVYLGLNAGFGNTDVALLPITAVDFGSGFITFPRPKTEIQRRVPMWPETVLALRAAIDCRPEPRDPTDRRLCFLMRTGRPWVRVRVRTTDDESDDRRCPVAAPDDAVAKAFPKLLRNLEINGRRGLGFYTLRRCFETYAGECKDQVAVDSVMGHVDPSMATVYRQMVSDERLRAAVDAVRTWLYPPAEGDEE